MKLKLYVLLLALFLMGNSSYAQRVGSYKIKNTQVVSQKHANPNYQKPKFYIMPEVGIGYSWNQDLPTDRQNLNKITAELGWEINKFFSFGFGIGYNYSTSNYNPISKPIISSMPLYFNMHGNFSKKKVSPYWSLDFGYAFNLKACTFRYGCPHNYYNYEKHHDCHYIMNVKERGIILSPEFGLRFGNFCYLGINASIFQSSIYKREDHGAMCDSYKHSYHGRLLDFDNVNLSLKLGFKIMKK